MKQLSVQAVLMLLLVMPAVLADAAAAQDVFLDREEHRRFQEPQYEQDVQPQYDQPYAPESPDAARTELRGQFDRFEREIDFTALGHFAVLADGRVKSFGSYSRRMMQHVSGPYAARGRAPWFMYFELMFRPEAWEDADIIHVRNRPMREQIAHVLREQLATEIAPIIDATAGATGPAAIQREELRAELQDRYRRLDRFERTGLIAPSMLEDSKVQALLDVQRQDLIRTARFVDEIETALVVHEPRTLRRNLRLIPPPGGGFNDPWFTFDDLAQSAAHLHEHGHPLMNIDPGLKAELLHQWEVFRYGWVAMDAARVNAAARELAALLPQINEELYPGEGSRTGWPWSFEEEPTRAELWKWTASLGLSGLAFLVALVGLFLRWQTVAMIGLVGTAGALVFHGTTLWLGTTNPLPLETWYFEARNMTWVWLLYAASLVPLTLALIFRWTPARWIGLGLFLLAFGFHTAALFIRWYVADRWPNSNMFEAVTTAAWFGGACAIFIELCVRRLPMRSLFALGSAAASMVALMATHFLPTRLDPNITNMMPVLHDVWLYIHTNVIILSYCLIFMAAVTATGYLLYRFVGWFGDFGGPNEYARFGGAASLIQRTPEGEAVITKAKHSIGQVLDGTTMVLVELSFILLWAGTVMGAIWADHSWGRPWGWDPKEVFALNTFIVFVILIHARLKARDKGMWTAWIALLGAAVMLFNWIAINFVVTGLHSYA